MKSIIKLFVLFLLVGVVANSHANNQNSGDSISITTEPIVVTPAYYMNGTMTSNLPVDPNIKMDTLASNKLVCYLKKNYATNAETVIELVYKIGSLMEDSTRQAQAFFTANYVAKYYSSIISNKFIGKINPIVDVEAKPDFTKFVFTIIASDEYRKSAISEFLKVLADSISFNTKLLEANKKDFIAQYNQNQFTELQYNLGKQPTTKYLNSITAIKLKQFHKDWYRPNLMSVIVVGNINVEQTQKELSTIFSKLKNPQKEKAIVYYRIPKKPTLQLTIVDDSTQTDNSSVQFYFKKFRNNRGSYTGYVETTLGIVSSLIMNKITEDFIKEKNILDYNVSTFYETFTKNEDAVIYNVVGKKEYIDFLTIRYLSLGEDVKNGGFFNEKQLFIAKTSYLKKIKNNSDLIETSSDYTKVFLNHFIYNLPLIGKKQEYEFANSIIEKFQPSNFTEFLESAFELNNISIVLKRPINTTYSFNNKIELLLKYNESLLKK